MSNKATLTELVKRSFVEMMKDVATSIPGHVASFDHDRQMAQIQIGIQRVDINGTSFDPPPLIEVPVYVYGGSEFSIDIQIDPGDEGIILFSQRCIDAWVNTGGIANNPILRFHDFSDAYFLPGLRSQPGKITGHNNNGIRLRDKTGASYIWLKNDGDAEIKVGVLNVVGEVTVTGDVHADTSGKNVSLVTHLHGGVTSGGSNTDEPV